jgi:hypothetical protein
MSLDEPANPFSLLVGLRKERRGEFPRHEPERPRYVYGQDEARLRARRRLEEWERDHGVRH